MLLEKHLARFGIKPGLERVRKICESLGNPQDKMNVILVTGTNGKGSTTAFLVSILKEAGYRVGAYYSPHLFKYNERFKINGKDISDSKLAKYEKEILALFKSGYEITLFEALTAIAYKYFADEKCDFAIMEIGMGGTYDATNIATEVAAIITNVDLEHTEYLGKTIEEIAADKAGIVKGASIVATAAEGKALEVIKRIVENEKEIQLFILGDTTFVKNVITTDHDTTFDYLGCRYYRNLKIRLLGDYQAKNAALAIDVADYVREFFFDRKFDEKEIRKGLANAKNPGRMQIISKIPLMIADAAHNVHGIKELIGNLNIFNYNKLVCVFGCMKDKNWQEILRLLGPHCDQLIANEIKNERVQGADILAEEANKYTKAIAIKDVKKSIKYAKKLAKKDDLILICGSIYMLGEAINAAKK